MEVVVFGAGSLGSLVGARLERVHDVTLVGRAPHVEAVRADGLAVTGVESFAVRPAATTDWRGGEADLGVVTVKAFDTPAAADALATGCVGAALSLQNGMGNEGVLADRLDAPVVAGTTSVGAELVAPGRVAWNGRGATTLGPWTADAGPAADRAGAAFRAAGFDVTVSDAVREHLWGKLAVNAAINPLTALAGVDNGAVAAAPLAPVARRAAAEVAGVARGAGVDLSDERAASRALSVARATADNCSSMRRDVEAGRRTEVDAINGFVLDRAGSADAVPVNATLAALVRAAGPDRGERSPDSDADAT
ncbi:MAG: ketopantoate reductase family protein [Haloferacaceae archaeon]